MARHVRDAENAWNTRDLDVILFSHTIDCHWRDRVDSLWGREQIRAFLQRRLRREIDSRLLLEGWAEAEGRLSLRFVREFCADSGQWLRLYGTEALELDAAGLVKRRLTTANAQPIEMHERALLWLSGPRPVDHPALTELGF
jgi:nuclear transport factor 2 (NTF2) superfamily protein